MNTCWILGIAAVGAAGCVPSRSVPTHDGLKMPLDVVRHACWAAFRRDYGEPHSHGTSLDSAAIMETTDKLIYGVQCEFSDMESGTYPNPRVDLMRQQDVGVMEIRTYLTKHGVQEQTPKQIAQEAQP